MPQPHRSSNGKKIEPLSWEVAAQAPALKGMTSFLDIPAEDIRSGRYVGPLALQTLPGVEAPPADVSSATTSLTKIRTMPQPQPAGPQSRTSFVPTVDVHGSSSVAVSQPAVKAATAGASPAIPINAPEVVAYPAYENTPGDETSTVVTTSVPSSRQVIPGRGRSKVRRCVLSQDGHSLGEEAIYQVMWRAGRPENQDPHASRTIRMGAADIGFKVNMAKKNVRQNISRLYDKLALEILEDFETMSSQPRLYRVFSFKQILERRRAVGMEFVLRSKGVVFCTSDGAEIVSSPAYVLAPGDETSIRPAPPKKRRAPLPPPIAPTMRAVAPSLPTAGQGFSAEIDMVAEALNRYWPVDEAAAEQLLRDCRRVRADARAEEIAFFVGEKLELARSNRNIFNPTGLVLATVPKSFAGATFDSFRERMERQSALVKEEKVRRVREQEDMRKWLDAEREKNEATVSDHSKTQQERDAAEKKLRQYATWNP